MSTSKKASPQIALLLVLSAFLVLLLTLILISPFDYLFPLIPASYYLTPSSSFSSWSHPDRTHPRVFTEDPLLERQNREYGSLPWEELLVPASGGGILAQRPPPLANGDRREEDKDVIISYGISMFHQLHCLITLRGLIFPETSHRAVNSTSKAHHSGHGHDEADKEHWAHCFDYIAQGIICAADDTIEEPKRMTVEGRTIYHIDGVDAVHQCRDSKRLWEISVEHLQHKADMERWKNGMGARQFFGEEGGRGEGVPGFYTKGM